MSEDSNNKQPEDRQEQQMLEEHKKMLIMTGKISDFQIKNLKSWPFILFEGVETVNIKYNFTQSEEIKEEVESICAGKVEFNIKLIEAPDKERIKTLKHWTKFLFWKDTEVVVKFDLVV